MRQDQFEALQARVEQLIDVFLVESDPAKWPGAGIEPANMDKSTRGDVYWHKKTAVATLACAQRCMNVLQVVREARAGTTPPAAESDSEPEDSLDAEVAAAEQEAAELMNEVQRRARKTEFDKRVHKSK